MEEERQEELDEVRKNYVEKEKELIQMQNYLMDEQNGGEEFKRQKQEEV